MRTVKPMRLGVLHRVIELGRKPNLIVTVFAATTAATGKELLPEAALWKLVEKNLGTGVILDEGYSKPAGEILIHGSFHAPTGKPEAVSFVGVDVTQDGKKIVDKRLAIVGRREWRSGVPTAPEPLETLKLDWAHAFGGDDHPTNPGGRGMKPKDSKAPWLLPQIEDPKHLVSAPSDRPRPAGFGPIDLGAVERRELAGDYGGDYVETRFPGPAANMDPRFFHTAREDQRITGFFRGGERISFVNMHPTDARVEAMAPPLRGRAFVERGVGSGLVEVPLRVDTIIAFPAERMVIAVHRGVVPVDEDDASDVSCLVIAGEDPSMPRPVEHYTGVVARRTNRDKFSALWAIHDEDLMPQREAGWGAARLPEDEHTAMTKTENLLGTKMSGARQRMLEEKRADLVNMGLDPDLYLPIGPTPEPPPPTDDVEGVIAYIEKLVARQDDEKAKVTARGAALQERAREEAKRAGMDWDAVMAQTKRDASGPPKLRVKAIRESMEAQIQLARNAGMPASDLEAMLHDPAFLRVSAEQEKTLLDGYRATAHHRDAAERLDRAASEAVRHRFLEARSAGKRPDDLDGTGADLSSLDLSGMDLDGALLECADLTDTVLDRTNLANAVLTRAKLDRTRFVNANLEGANLGDTTFSDVDLSGAKLKKAWLAKSRVEKASFARADLTEAFLLEASFGAVDFSGAILANVAFYKLDLTKARFARATLKKAQFVECDLSHADFTEAVLDGAVWLKTRAEAACLAGASMKQSAWPAEVTAPRIDLTGAHIERACFRGANLQRADFTRAALIQCDLGNADLTEAKLVETNAKGTMFIRANLTRASARGASFVEAILSNATLAGADFSKANLFRAILSRARGDDATRFTGANLETVLHEPRYEAKRSEAGRG